MSLPLVDLKAQYGALKSQIQSRIDAVLQHGQYIAGPEVAELEERLAAYTGASYCVTVGSGTQALLISLLALGVGPGDEVITTPFSFIACAEVIVLLGASPVFVDIEPDTCNIDASLIEARITPRTKAIMPVSLYGQPADMHQINAIAARHGNIPVIEDAAQSFGASYHGRKSGNLSSIACTSFYPSKPLGCYGDGGAIFTSNEAIAQACQQIRDHGQSARYQHARVGIGGRMDTIQCAVVLAKLERFVWEVQRRFELGKRYNAMFDDAGLARVRQRPDRSSVFAQYVLMVENRDQVQHELMRSGVPTAVHYPMPVNEQGAYRSLSFAGSTPVSQQASTKVMSLPMSADLSDQTQVHIVEKVMRAVSPAHLS
jgi:UDP-2-acetamido-2-deoxy-ribo-hexuluronate aminotransferase